MPRITFPVVMRSNTLSLLPKGWVPHHVDESCNQVAIVTDYSCHVSFFLQVLISLPVSGFLLVRDTLWLILLRSSRRT